MLIEGDSAGVGASGAAVIETTQGGFHESIF